MESNDIGNTETKFTDLRKDAAYKTIQINRNNFKKTNWRKAAKEKYLAAEGKIADAGLPVVAGNDPADIVWDLSKYSFMQNNYPPYTVNPKLWEHGKFNLNAGLFKITDNIYQIRGFDASNMTLVRGSSGWIIIDCLSTRETAEAALSFADDNLEKINVSAAIITHSHADHYGGIAAAAGRFIGSDAVIYAPAKFTEHVIEENVTAGTAMSRRAVYQYGVILPRDKKGQIDIGIGKGMPAGTLTFVPEVHEIDSRHETIEIDKVTMEFLQVTDTEAPSEMFIYIPAERSLCIAGDANATMHNLYTLRGAKVRDALAWAGGMQKAIDLWGDSLTSVFSVHNWHRRGNEASLDYLEKQRDIYQYINDQTLRLINQGHTIDDIGRMVALPDSLADEWYNSEFYGTVSHNVKAVYQKYMGWYSGNPVDLNRLFPEDAAKKYVEYMGGEENVLEKAKRSLRNGEYQWVAEVTRQVIFANPNNREAKLLCADALEQLGYTAESGIWRNEYLTGAHELRYGKVTPAGSIISDEVLNSLPLANIMYLISIRINGPKAGNFNYKINFRITGRDETAATEIRRGIFRYLGGSLSQDAAVSVTMPKEVFYTIAATNLKPDLTKIVIDGNSYKWYAFLSVLDRTDPGFDIMTPVPR